MSPEIINIQKNGFCIGPNVINEKNILFLRKYLEIEFNSKNNIKQIHLFEIKNKELLVKILNIFNDKKINNFIENLSYEYKNNINFIPQFVIQRNYHVDRLNSPSIGWHRDCGGELKYKFCEKKLKNKDYFFAKIGIYLQENTKYGGSIDVIPYSHKLIKFKKFSFIRKYNNFKILLLKHFQNKFSKLYGLISESLFMKFLNAKKMYPTPGSFILFDSRTVHRGSPVEDSVRNNALFKSGMNFASVPQENTKYSLYVDIGNSVGFDSYMYDRSQRKTKIDEITLLKENMKMIKNYAPELYINIEKLVLPIISKYSKFNGNY